MDLRHQLVGEMGSKRRGIKYGYDEVDLKTNKRSFEWGIDLKDGSTAPSAKDI